MLNVRASDNTPFIVGLSSHPDIDPAGLARLVGSAADFLRDLKAHLPDTDLRLMVEPCGDAALGIARAALALGVSVDALSGAGARADLTSDARLRCIEVAPAAAADVLIRRSSLLLALWDGTASREHDDTADRVFRFLGVRVDRNESVRTIEIAASPDLDVGVRLVYWVPAVRSGSAPCGHAQPGYLLAAGDNVLDVHGGIPPSLLGRLADLNEFNCEYARFRADGRLTPSESLLRDLPAQTAGGDAPLLAAIDQQYTKADALAGHMQWRSDRLFSLFGVMTFAMGFAYLLYDKVTESRLLLIVYMILLFAGVLAYYLFQGKRWFGKHLSYRALAETLRVRFYLALAGVDRRMQTQDLIALTGIDKFHGFSWISYVLHTIEPVAAEARPTGEIYLDRARLVEQAWVENQYRYYGRKVAQMEKESRRVSRLKTVMFLAILVDISVMFVFGDALSRVDARIGMPVKNVVEFCSGFLAVLLGVWELRHNKMATRELLWQYRSQLSQFERARVQLQRKPSRARREDLLVELGSNSLMEIYLWAIHRYHREHSPPTAP